MRFAAIGDLHCRVDSAEAIRAMLDGVEREAEILVLAGDLTNGGLPAEMEALLEGLQHFSLPVVAVMGNHDHENDHVDLLARMMDKSGVCVLDGTTCEINGVGFVGTKGFCSGFGELSVQPFGERALKAFIQTGIDEASRLEKAAAHLNTPRKVAVLHYAPVKATLQGESPELYPFLGSSLLADALEHHGVDAIVHGHAHRGSPQGQTPRGIPVYNVSRFVLRRYTQRAYRVLEI